MLANDATRGWCVFKMSRDKLQGALRELDQARYNHERWYKDLIRTIACGLPIDRRDLAEDSYRQCRFGQWYYAIYDEEFAKNKTFVSIETEHRKMHDMAAKLLGSVMREEAIAPTDYDNFANVLDRLQINLEALKHEIEETLYNRDPLTGVHNRVSMLSDLRKLQELVQRDVQKSAICLMDLDHFKEINDRYGHQTGDRVLVAVTRYIMDHIRPYDKIYRYGGEEFLIVMPNTDTEVGTQIVERLRDGLGTLAAVHHGLEPLQITASFGLTMLVSEITVEEAIDRADRALYVSKGNGRNMLSVWERSMEQALPR